MIHTNTSGSTAEWTILVIKMIETKTKYFYVFKMSEVLF